MGKNMKDAVLVTGMEIEANDSISRELIMKVQENCDGTGEEILARLFDLKNSIDESYFEMGGLLRTIYDNKLYRDLGYSDWKNFVQDKIGFQIRKAKYLMRIYKYFVVEVGNAELISKISSLGWSKVKALVYVVDSQNVDEWVEKCKDATVMEVFQKVSQFKAIKKGFLAKQTKKAALSFSFKLHEGQSGIVENAFKLAGKLSHSEDKNNNLSLMAQDYLDYNSSLVATDLVVQAEMMKKTFKKLELAFGVKLTAVGRFTGNILYGHEPVND